MKILKTEVIENGLIVQYIGRWNERQLIENYKTFYKGDFKINSSTIIFDTTSPVSIFLTKDVAKTI